MDNKKINFTRKALSKAEDIDDQLIKFVILWIGLNALYDTDKGKKKEGEKVRDFFKNNEKIITKVINEEKHDRTKVEDVIYNKYPIQHQKIGEFLNTRWTILIKQHPDRIKHLGEFLYQVRNNMFHSAKEWEEEAEVRLLSEINPIMVDILKKLTRERQREVE